MQVLLRSMILLMMFALAAPALACGGPVALCGEKAAGALALIADGRPLRVLADPADDPGVLRARAALASDLARVGGGESLAGGEAIIVGTLGRSPLVDRLVAAGKLDARGVAGRWEAYVQEVVDRPAPGIARALVIAGADRRGTIFGIYDLSRRAGVSPWSWWADVPVKQRQALWLLPGRRVEAPAVRYRGIFINDEDPALAGWARATFGGLDHRFYERVFDLVLRLRGNMIWPAMWGKSFYEDDPANGPLAQEMGVIIGTSHHEPLMRAHVDWERHGRGPWDYAANAERLRAFWREGLERSRGMDRIVTVGMRGDGDEPMTRGTATQLLERIVADQRRIIEQVTGRPAAETPQVWALYKEVQDYYDAGMRVPDDVTLLFADDNWGNIRRLPEPGAKRAGGYGVYYHFDYVGGPRNYKWIDTNSVPRIWQQMKMARDSGADRLWIVNVGDIKPMEYPISFFLDMAWDPDGMTLERMEAYPASWAAEQFGPALAGPIGELLTRYGQLAARRKPELLDAGTYDGPSGEWTRVMREWRKLRSNAETIEAQVRPDRRDAYFELVLHRILAMENLHALYYAVARNRFYAAEGNALANGAADQAEAAFRRDGELRRRYEVETAGGKWTQMMSQTHIGYTGWQQPPRDVMPEVRRVSGPAGRAMDAPERVPESAGAPPRGAADAFVEKGGVVAIEAEHHAGIVDGADGRWRTIANLGRTASGVAHFPQTTPPVERPGAGTPHLLYRIFLARSGPVDLRIHASPGLDVRGRGRHRYGVSVDGGPITIVDLLAGETEASWNRAVADNIRIGSTRLHLAAGAHQLRLWLVDPELVFQRVVLARPGTRTTYLGPPESVRR